MAVNTRDLLQFLRAHHSAAIEAHLDTTLAALADQWQPARAQIASRIGWLQDLMQQAQDAGVEIDPTWLAQEQRLTTLLREIDDATQSFADDARSTIGDAQLDAIDLAQQAAQEYMQAALPDGVAATFGVPPQGALDAMASALEEDSPLSALFDAFGADASASASQALFSAVALGQSAAQIADLLERTTDMSAQRAEVIARTELLRSYRDAQMANYRANADVVTAWMWSASFSERTCGACLAMDSTIHPLEDSLDDHICGRCTALPVTTPYKDILGQLGIDASANPALALDTTAFAGILGAERQTGAEWLAAQDYATQVRILGPAKAAAIYKYGDITLQDLVGINKSALWGDSIREHSLRELGLNARDYLTEFRLPPRELLGAGEAAVTAEAERLASAVTDRLGVGATLEDARALAKADALSGGRGAVILAELAKGPVNVGQDAAAALREVTERMFGRELTRDELGGLVGAPEGSYVTITIGSAKADALGLTLHGPSWDPQTPWSWSEYSAERSLYRDESGALVAFNRVIEVDESLQGGGLGTQIFADEAHTLSGLGVKEIGTLASEPYPWARLGYDGLLPAETRAELRASVARGEAPAPWRNYRSVKQLMRTEEGRAWFKANVDYFEGTFDLTPNSYSMRTLQAYLDEKGIATTLGTTTAAAQESFDWEAEHVAELSRSLGIEPPPALFGRQVEQGNAAWEDWYHTHLAPLLPDGYVDPVFGPASADDVPFSEARALSQYMNTVQASYDLTAEDQTFAAQIREQIGQLDQNALAHTDALEIGGQLHDRITGDAEMARYQGYAQEFAEMRAKGPEFFTPDEAAWAKNDPDAIAAHGGVKFLDAVARVQAEYQARVAAYLSAVRDMGGELDVVARTGSTVADRVFDDITAAQTNLPSDWIAASNDLGQLRINSVGRASNYGGYYQGFYNGNGAIALYTDMVRDVEVQSTFTHEFMHRMEDVLPQLGRLETEFYNARTAGDALVDLTNGIQMQTKLDQWVDEYLGRVPFATSQGGQSYELLSIGAEAALGGGAGFDMAALREDREFMSFVLGLLTIVRADGAAAGAEAAAAVTAIDEATAALDAINAADQGAQRAFSVASEGRDEASIVTYVSDAARERLARPFGGQALSDDEVARLAGAPPGSSVTVSRIGEITVTPPDGRYTSSVIVQQGDAGAPALLNWRFEAPDGSNGIPVDPEALAMQVRQANALGVESIHMKSRAASNDYALLPQLGYNASIGVALTESRSASLPADLRDARTLLDLLATPEGRAWWGENGLNPGLDFDPRPGSRSWLTLNAYLHDHGLKGLDE